MNIVDFVMIFICLFIFRISHFISEKSKPKSDPLSPIGSIHSPKSPAELFSPVAKSLNDMFSPSGSQTSQSNVFGGPAIDMGGRHFYFNINIGLVSSIHSFEFF